MNKKEFATFAMAMKTYYPRDNILPNERSYILWFEQLSDIPYEVASAVLKKWVATEKWSPTIADIRAMAHTVTEGETEDWGKAWEMVLKAISRFGMYNETDALNSLPPIAKETVRRMGFREICLSEKIAVERANFREIYEELFQKQAKKEILSDALKNQIEDIQQKRLQIATKGVLKCV